MRILAVFLIASAATAGVNWERDFEKAKTRAVREGKLLFVDIYAEW